MINPFFPTALDEELRALILEALSRTVAERVLERTSDNVHAE